MAEKWTGDRDDPGDHVAIPEPERYVAVDLAVLQAVKVLAGLKEHSPATIYAMRLVLRVARVDEVSGQVVVGLRLVHDLDPPDDSGHFGTI